MKDLGSFKQMLRFKRLATGVCCLLVVGAAVAGWQIHRATDTTLIDPIVLPDDVELRSGDIIVAGGISLQSRFVRSMTGDNRYSHVGMIEATPHGLYVIHAAPEGEGDGGAGDKVARIPLTLFLAERGYVAVKVMRLNHQVAAGNQVAEEACAFAAQCVEEAVPFDASFDLTEHDKMYCSELIYLAYQDAGYDWPDTLIIQASNLIVDGPAITPGAFADCTDFNIVWQH